MAASVCFDDAGHRLHRPPCPPTSDFAQHEFTAPFLLCSSDCESLTLAELLALEPTGREALDALWLGYTEAHGSPSLRQAIAALYDHVDAAQVLVHAGAEEAIFNFMNVALSPGDHVVVHAPHYQSLSEVARGIGVEVSDWRGDAERGWELDLSELERLLTPRTRLVVVNFPHNPTGFLPTTAFVHALSALSDQHDFVVFADEVYRGLELEPATRPPAFADVNARAVSLGGLSKAYGLAGLRIGWLATRDPRRFAALSAFKDYTTLCNSAPSELLAALALRHAGPLVERNLGLIRANLDRLDRFFEAHRDLFAWHRPQAGSIAFPRLLRGKVDEFCADLVAKTGVLLLPGTLYGEDFGGAFRVGFGRKNLPEALERLEAYLTGR